MQRNILFIAIWAIAVMGYTCNVPPIDSGFPPGSPDNDTLPLHVVDGDGEVVGPVWRILLYLPSLDRAFGPLVVDADRQWEVSLVSQEMRFEGTDCTGQAYRRAVSPLHGGWESGGELWAYSDGLDRTTCTTNSQRLRDGTCENIEIVTECLKAENVTPADWPPPPPLTMVWPDVP